MGFAGPVDQLADGAAGGIVDPGDAAGADGHEFLRAGQGHARARRQRQNQHECGKLSHRSQPPISSLGMVMVGARIHHLAGHALLESCQPEQTA